jgi:archaellum component FlaF (FlaF/FlaG flagellin family)
VSEIVAGLILVLVISAAGIALYTYSLSTFASTGSSFRQRISLKEERARERLAIIAVWWDPDTTTMNVTVLNYGKIEIVIDSVYVNWTLISSGLGKAVDVGDWVPVEFTLPTSILIRAGQTYEIRVVTERGSKDAVYWEA